MREMIKLPDGTWTYSASSSPKVELNMDLPDNIEIVNNVEDIPPRRKARERKAKP